MSAGAHGRLRRKARTRTSGLVLPDLSAAADALRWRHSILPAAEARAQALGHGGAAFPWRTIHGEEGSGYWPAGTAAFHVNADIADAVIRYVQATGDERFEREVGVDLLVKTARLWRSLGHHDLVLAMARCPYAFTAEQMERNFDYYERITVRDSSLSACIQAVLAAECDHLRLAFDYAAEATLMDLQDLEHNVRDGLHIASLSGAWIAFVFGLGGMRDHGDVLRFSPKLPDGLTRFAFSITHRQQCLRVNVTAQRAEYVLATPGTLRIAHHGESLTVTDAAPIARPIPSVRSREPPTQPPGREPRRRSPG